MPLAAMSTDRKILLVGGIAALLLCTVAVLAGTTQQTESEWPSSYASGRGGAKAAYLLLHDLGYKVERESVPPAALAEVTLPATLVLAQPMLAATPAEKAALNAFLMRGGRVLAVGPQAAWMLGAGGSVRMGFPHSLWKTYPRVTPSALTRRAPAISLATQWYWDPNRNERSMVHYAADGEAVVASYHVGRGEVIWWASATPMTNNGIQEKDNVLLFLDSVGEPGTRVIWDEYYHEGARTAMDSILSSPLKWGLVQLGMIGVFVLLTFSRRHGPVSARRERTRLSPLEFTDALAHLYRRAHAANVGLEVAYERFRHAALHRLGLPASASALHIAAAFEARFGKQGAAQVLAQAESLRYNHETSEATTLELVKTLHRYTMQLDAFHTRKQGKH
jgi:hypothetical protein